MGALTLNSFFITNTFIGMELATFTGLRYSQPDRQKKRTRRLTSVTHNDRQFISFFYFYLLCVNANKTSKREVRIPISSRGC